MARSRACETLEMETLNAFTKPLCALSCWGRGLLVAGKDSTAESCRIAGERLCHAALRIHHFQGEKGGK